MPQVQQRAQGSLDWTGGSGLNLGLGLGLGLGFGEGLEIGEDGKAHCRRTRGAQTLAASYEATPRTQAHAAAVAAGEGCGNDSHLLVVADAAMMGRDRRRGGCGDGDA